MQITQSMFDRIVGTHVSNCATAKAAVLPVGCRRMAERRQSLRAALGKRSQISLDSGTTAGKWETVLLQDISLSGLGLLSHTPLSNGETFLIKLSQIDGTTARIRCKACRCESGGFGGVSFLIGATFVQIIQESIRVNDDHDGPASNWENAAPIATMGVGTVRQAGGVFARAAKNLLKAAALRIHRHDDFSSM